VTPPSTAVAVVGPVGLANPARPSGGNVYDLRLAAALRARGREVEVHETTAELLAESLAALPAGGTVVVDGLVACAAPEALEAHARRLRLVVLVHLPLGVPVPGSTPRPEQEARSLAVAAAVVCTSRWTRDWLAASYGVAGQVVHPGVDKAGLAEPSRSGGRLLSVGAIAPVKGHDVLVRALSALARARWSWTLVGASVDPDHATALWADLCAAGLDDRVRLAGALTGPDLASAYAGADLVVLPSRHETDGKVATEALARGVPVLAADVGGLPEALGEPVPGLLVTPGDPSALAAALAAWLGDPRLRATLRHRAAARRVSLTGWDETARAMAAVLDVVGGNH
jgi:glycosyltransferase involved in cell wall biosynthesis